jgi:hypothetical protein
MPFVFEKSSKNPFGSLVRKHKRVQKQAQARKSERSSDRPLFSGLKSDARIAHEIDEKTIGVVSGVCDELDRFGKVEESDDATMVGFALCIRVGVMRSVPITITDGTIKDVVDQMRLLVDTYGWSMNMEQLAIIKTCIGKLSVEFSL